MPKSTARCVTILSSSSNVPSSSRNSMRSRADILPSRCCRSRRSLPPPSSASPSRRFNSANFCSRFMRRRIIEAVGYQIAAFSQTTWADRESGSECLLPGRLEPPVFLPVPNDHRAVRLCALRIDRADRALFVDRWTHHDVLDRQVDHHELRLWLRRAPSLFADTVDHEQQVPIFRIFARERARDLRITVAVRRKERVDHFVVILRLSVQRRLRARDDHCIFHAVAIDVGINEGRPLFLLLDAVLEPGARTLLPRDLEV